MSLREIAARSAKETAFRATENYEWFQYTLAQGLVSKNSKGRTLSLKQGDKFGMRRGDKTGLVRLVKEEAQNNVFTCDEELAEALSQHSKAIKAPSA